jgi:uncharacterized protein (TIGR03437 family)
MWKRALFIGLMLLGSTGLVFAQFDIPPATVGVPYSVDLSAVLFGGELSTIEQYFNQAGVNFSISFSAGAGLPPGLTLSSAGVISGTPSAPGMYPVTISIAVMLSYMGTTYINESVPIPLSLEVDGFKGSSLSVDPSGITFSFTLGTKGSQTQLIGITNHTAQPQNFSASTTGGPWLSVSPSSGSAALGSTPLTVTVDSSQLAAAGTYSGSVSITLGSGKSFVVSVVVTVSGGQQSIELSQTGFRFQAVASSGAAPPAQSLLVFNGGSGSVSFNASASVISGGPWLSVSPTSGNASATSSQTLTIKVNPTGLAAGDYYGQVQISSPGAQNSPQTASAVLNVAAAGTDLGAFLQPTGLIFIAQAGGANPAAQTVSVTNPSSSPLMFASSASFTSSSAPLMVQPSSGSITATSPVQLQIQPAISGLAAGVYLGDVALYLSDGTVKHVGVALILTGATALAQAAEPHAAGCTPTKLIPVFTQLGASFATVASWPTPIEATVVDDCGTFLTTGSVVASFSSGDSALSLLSLQDGRWAATWQPRSSATQVTITVQAQEASPALQGTASIGGTLQANPSTPVINAGGAVSAASLTLHQPLAPGSFVSIFGANLSAGQSQSNGLPLATQLGATQVFLAGKQLPMQFAAGGQVNAIVPYDIAANSTQQLIVMNGPAISVPEPVVIAPAEPAVFTQDFSGHGAGIVVGVKPDQSQFVVDANHPLSAGDIAVIYCAGLGPVNPSVPAGTAAPLSPLSYTTNTVTVTMGGVNAPVAFAGLAPGFAGLYQVNATVPSGITPGSNVQLVLTEAGQSSLPVTITVQ